MLPCEMPPCPSRHLRQLAGHVGGAAAAFPAARTTASSETRLLRSAWTHNSIELSERPVQRPGHRVLTDADHAFLAEHGWLLVRNAVPQETVARCVSDTWQYLDDRMTAKTGSSTISQSLPDTERGRPGNVF